LWLFLIAAAIALLDVPNMDAEKILLKSMKIAGDFCVYTNHNLVVESLGASSGTTTEDSSNKPVVVPVADSDSATTAK
jgi:ATP-dependent HslUV protease subunit HslV